MDPLLAMDPPLVVALSCLTALAGAAAAYAGVRLADRARLKGVHTRADEILRAARDEAETVKKEAELKAKDDLYQQREAFNRETEQVRGELRDQERRLDKREDGLEEKAQALAKKERSLDNLKTKLSERKADLERQALEAEALVQRQSQKLHEISGFGREQAERVLMERLEKELADQVAARLHRHEEGLKQTCEEKARRVLATAIHRY